jgi:hypothetical protein
MRPLQAVVLALAAGPLLGCLPTRPAGGAEAVEALRPPSDGAEDLVDLDVVVMERPAGEPYFNQELWALADEQASEERKALLEDNGFRVAQVGGILPDGLLRLLEAGRSCVDPRRCTARAGSARELEVGAAWPWCRFRLRQDGGETPVEVSGARLALEVVPTLTADGRTRLHFTPVVKHGGVRIEPRAVRAPSGEHRWELDTREPRETYEWLAWDVTVAPNEYVLMGTRLDHEGTLGHRFFLQAGSDGIPRQRLLLLRTWRQAPAAAAADDAPRRAAPLALQASWTSARGCGP